MPVSDSSSVRGIGVAESVSTSTSARSALMRSLCCTPNRCSSSTTSRPRSLNATSSESSRCVPMTTSTSPLATPGDDLRLLLRGEEPRAAPRPAPGSSRSARGTSGRAGSASSVVGTRTATCLPSCTALNAARIATSVLPKPTSPHTRRSIGIVALHVGLHGVDRLRAGRASPRTGTPPPSRAATACRAGTRGRASRAAGGTAPRAPARSRASPSGPGPSTSRSRRRPCGAASASRRRCTCARCRPGRWARRACRCPCTRAAGSRARRRRSRG